MRTGRTCRIGLGEPRLKGTQVVLGFGVGDETYGADRACSLGGHDGDAAHERAGLVGGVWRGLVVIGTVA